MSVLLPPRPNDPRTGMTRIGALRDEYNATMEGRPTRFVKTLLGYEPIPAYFEWAARVDAWAESAEVDPMSVLLGDVAKWMKGGA